MNMKDWNIQTIFIYATFLFWGIPFLQDLLPKQDANEILWTCMSLVNSAYCFITCLSFSRTNQTLQWYLPVGLMLIFAPLPFLFVPLQALILLPIYGVCATIGMVIGKQLKKK